METALQVLTPQPANDEMIQLLRLISEAIQKEFLPLYIQTDHKWNKLEGIRSIQNGRWELFVQSKKMECQAFDVLCELILSKLPEHLQSTASIRCALIAYAQACARLDQRLPETIQFGHAFSFIITSGIVPSQHPHIDILFPDYQFGLIVTDGVPATNWYRSKIAIVCTAEALANFLHVDQQSTNLVRALHSFPVCVQLLEQFGACLSTLHSTDYEQVVGERECLPVGSVMSLPGGLLHAGPASSSYRTVMFFTAHVDEDRVYNPDVQYFDGLLLAELMLPIWPFLTVSDRKCFLWKLNIVIDRYKVLYRHFESSPDFQLLLQRWAESTDPQAIIQSCVGMSQLARIPVGSHLSEKLTCVSAKHLRTIYDGISYAIVVYRRPNGTVCMQVRLFGSSRIIHTDLRTLIFAVSKHIGMGRNGP